MLPSNIVSFARHPAPFWSDFQIEHHCIFRSNIYLFHLTQAIPATSARSRFVCSLSSAHRGFYFSRICSVIKCWGGHSSSSWFCPRFCSCPHLPHILPQMFARPLAPHVTMTRNGKWEGKGKHWWQSMEEIGARAKTTPLKLRWGKNISF